MGSSITIRCQNCFNDDRKGSYYELYLDCGMMCFTKEQLEKYYGVKRKELKDYHKLTFENPLDDFYSKEGYFLDNDIINNEIITNIKKGYEFTNNMGYTPYYCETCNKLESYFYFQMKMKDNIYIPNYDCEICKNHIEPLKIIYEADNEEDYTDEENPNQYYGINYVLFVKNDNTIKITTEKNDEKKLTCHYCKHDVFIRDENAEIMWD